MTRTSNLNTFLAMIVLLVTALTLLALMLSPAVPQIDSIDIPWKLRERGFNIPRDLEFSKHALTGHTKPGELNATKIYEMFLEDTCTAEDRFCAVDTKHGAKELYLCRDPITGLVGFLVVFMERWSAPKIHTGYGVTWDHDKGAEYMWGKIFIEDFWGEEGAEWGICP